MYFDIGDAMQAEIRQALKVVHSNYSYNSVDDDSERFKKMFPDSAIAQQYCMKSDKLAYIVNFGLSPYFKDILLSKTKQSLFLAVSFDESYCKAIHKKQMDVIIKYYDSKNVHTQYLTSQFLCHSRATDLKYHIEETLKDLTKEKIIQISMDGPKVNWCFFQKMVQQRNADGLPGFISLGSCSLHVLHGAFRHGVEETEWGVMSILRNLDLLLTSFNPGRREDFTKETGCEVFPLSFCQVRWLESRPAAIRAIEMWPSVLKMVEIWKKVPKSQRPKGIPYDVILKAIGDPLTVLRLHFFTFVSSVIYPFLERYQSDLVPSSVWQHLIRAPKPNPTITFLKKFPCSAWGTIFSFYIL